jgi:hypothetical protein
VNKWLIRKGLIRVVIQSDTSCSVVVRVGYPCTCVYIRKVRAVLLCTSFLAIDNSYSMHPNVFPGHRSHGQTSSAHRSSLMKSLLKTMKRLDNIASWPNSNGDAVNNKVWDRTSSWIS